MQTLLARYGSRQAEVALCDALVSESVGKRGGKQAVISSIEARI